MKVRGFGLLCLTALVLVPLTSEATQTEPAAGVTSGPRSERAPRQRGWCGWRRQGTSVTYKTRVPTPCGRRLALDGVPPPAAARLAARRRRLWARAGLVEVVSRE